MTDVSKPIENLEDEQVKRFVSYLLLGRKDNEAARLAGFTQPRTAAVRLLQDPHVLAEIEKSVSGRLRGELAPKALIILDDILSSKSTSRTLKLAAAKTTLDRSGYVPPKAQDRLDDPIRSLAEQGPEELKAFIAQAQQELANRAKPILDGKAKEVKPAKRSRKASAEDAKDVITEARAELARRREAKALPPANDAELAGLLD